MLALQIFATRQMEQKYLDAILLSCLVIRQLDYLSKILSNKAIVSFLDLNILESNSLQKKV